MNGESKIEYIQVYSVNRKDRSKKIFDFLPTIKMDDKGKTPQVPSYQYFDKDYSKASASEDTGGAERSDYRHTLGLKTLTNLSEDLFASFKYEYIDANSNLPSADYNENIVTISLGRNW